MLNFQIPSGANQLEAFFHSAPSGPGRPLLIVCHGFCGSSEGGSSLELAAVLREKDIAVLRFRFTPQRCLSQQVSEIGDVVGFCRDRLGNRLALLGRSMGAAASLAFAAKDRQLSGLCLMASPADLPSTFRGILGEDYRRLESGNDVTVYHEGEPVHLTPAFIRDFDRYDLPSSVRSLKGIPLFIIHGLEDDTVPVSHGRQLFDAAGEPKQLLLLPGHSHSFTVSPERFVPAISEWLVGKVFPPCL